MLQKTKFNSNKNTILRYGDGAITVLSLFG